MIIVLGLLVDQCFSFVRSSSVHGCVLNSFCWFSFFSLHFQMIEVLSPHLPYQKLNMMGLIWMCTTLTFWQNIPFVWKSKSHPFKIWQAFAGFISHLPLSPSMILKCFAIYILHIMQYHAIWKCDKAYHCLLDVIFRSFLLTVNFQSYSCEHCGKEFTSKRKHQRHVLNVHFGWVKSSNCFVFFIFEISLFQLQSSTVSILQ